MAALVLLLALATVAGAAAASAAAAAAPCPAQPCPGHAGRTYCPSVSTPHQCDQPSHPPCPPCKGPPIPPPPTPPIPPPPPKPTHRPWLDATLLIPQRVSLLMAEMTLEEKLLQLVHADLGYGPPPSNGGRGSWNQTEKVLALGGWGATSASGAAIGPPSGPHLRGAADGPQPACSPPGGAECRITALRELQLAFLNHTRLGIPVSFIEETSHSGGAGGTIFPMGVTQGATWNVSLSHAVGEAIALEARSKGIDRGLSPEINVSGVLVDARTEQPTTGLLR